LLKTLKPSDIFSWRSPSFKAQGLKAEELNDDDLVRLMLQEPRLVRRPMIRIGTELVIGGSPSNIEKALEGL
jgi:arsenate reductase/regulatory protein spx